MRARALKARAPLAVQIRARIPQGSRALDLRLRFEPTNGAPLGLVLLPLASLDPPPTLPSVEDLRRLPLIELAPVAPGGEWLDLRLDWPTGLAAALLLLLHGQSAGCGDALDATAGAAPQDIAELLAAALRDQGWHRLEGGLLPSPELPQRPQAFEFALASCQYPEMLLDGGAIRPGHATQAPELGPSERSLWRLAQRWRGAAGERLLLATGDHVYVDATAGLFDPANLHDGLAAAYAARRRHRGLRALRREHPSALLLDDHEIDDNWEPLRRRAAPQRAPRELAPALQAYRAEHGLGADAPIGGAQRHGGLDFFLLDTRTRREARDLGNWRRAQLVDAAQRAAVAQWLADGAGQRAPAFLVSPAMPLPRPRGLAAEPALALGIDAWCGYPASLDWLLRLLWQYAPPGLVLLSGDEHLGSLCWITLSDGGRDYSLPSLHCPPLYAPYPFANARPEQFAAVERFAFGEGLECRVDTRFAPAADGFVLLRPRPQAGRWGLELEFDQLGHPPGRFNLELARPAAWPARLPPGWR